MPRKQKNAGLKKRHFLKVGKWVENDSKSDNFNFRKLESIICEKYLAYWPPDEKLPKKKSLGFTLLDYSKLGIELMLWSCSPTHFWTDQSSSKKVFTENQWIVMKMILGMVLTNFISVGNLGIILWKTDGFSSVEPHPNETTFKPWIRFAVEHTYGVKIIKIAISTKRDTVCCASEDGELFLHRFEKFERVWKLERLENFPNAKITGICWRPDGRALAISYKSV